MTMNYKVKVVVQTTTFVEVDASDEYEAESLALREVDAKYGMWAAKSARAIYHRTERAAQLNGAWYPCPSRVAP